MYYKEIDEDGLPVTDGYYAIASSKGYLEIHKCHDTRNYGCYNYSYTFDDPEYMFSVANYCSQHFKDQWVIGIGTSFFESKEDLMLFKLRVQ